MSAHESLDEKETDGSRPVHMLGKESDVEGSPAADVEQDDGVTRIEALYLVFSKGWKLWMLYGSLAILAFVYALSNSTTSTYQIYAASSFASHPLIGTIATVVGIMYAVAPPFIAKVADLSSRPAAMTLSVIFYCIGYIVVAASKTIGAVAGGQVIYTIGNSGISFINGLILADITSLQWRGFIQGLNSTPFILTAFLAGNITTGISANTANGWRWGYGMFVIIVPACIAPIVLVLFWADWKAKKIGALSVASSSYARRKLAGKEEHRSVAQTVLHYARIIDAFGLLLLGTAFALVLLPFTLYTEAKDHWKNPSLIAMFVVGGVLLIAFGFWELKVASHPIMPRRVINKTLICCLVIDFIYFLSGNITLTYFSSYVYVVKDWSLTNYTYFTNIVTVGLCVFGVLAGTLQRITHRYKYIQFSGLCIMLIGQGLMYLSVHGNKSDAVLVMSQILTSLGGAFSGIASTVATQASVPHQDMALAIALLQLWTNLGGGIGSAVSAAIWNAKLPANLEKRLGGTLNSTQLSEIYGSILVARVAEPRAEVIQAYDETASTLFLVSLILSFVSLIAGALTSNFYLGTTHNAIEDKVITLRDASETDEEVIRRKAAEIEARVKEAPAT
ncbi:major facilitator superfamily domain-containing protein [Mycena belliarum]|uniref:Major facilitator superfamily domain-containing protein n=1 Tax=Mycena belliarum TaxID=1033014 RepID=A0AAD6TSG9_9AGAR|nr:major facilitator superfamily domain-containing protein [Mycena belliae]